MKETIEQDYGADGLDVGGTITTYTYDAQGHVITSVRESFGSDLIERQTFFYAYDATGNLIETVNEYLLRRFVFHRDDEKRILMRRHDGMSAAGLLHLTAGRKDGAGGLRPDRAKSFHGMHLGVLTPAGGRRSSVS